MFVVIMFTVLLGQYCSAIPTKMKRAQDVFDVGIVWSMGNGTDFAQASAAPEKSSRIDRMFKRKSSKGDRTVPRKFIKNVGIVPKEYLQTDGMVPEVFTENYKRTRHISRKKIKAMVKRYTRDCMDKSSLRCIYLLRKIVRAKSGHKQIPRDLMGKINFRYCLSGTSIVHFDPQSQLCCNGLFNKSSGSEECCNGDVIDSREELCCNSRRQNRTEWTDCCGTFTYDTRNNTCCKGTLHPNRSTCCGDDIYNPDKEICCFESDIFKLNKGDSCCGKSVYNSSTHTCCEANVQPIYGRQNRRGACCKNESYHTECYKCEDGTILPVFNESSKICCEGKIRDRKYDNHTGCCSRKVFHTKNQRCLDNEIQENLTPESIPATPNTTEGTFSREEHEYNDKKDDDTQSSSTRNIIIGGVSAFGLVGVLSVLCCSGKKIRKRCKREATQKYDTTLGKWLSSSFENSNQRLNNADISNSPLHTQIYLERPRSLHDTLSTDVNFENQYNENSEKLVSSITKIGSIPTENILVNHYKNTFTQTCPEKESNRRTIFGKPFDHNFILGMSNGTAQMPDSEVKMTLPQSVLKHHEVEVNCTTFRTLSPLRKKLGLSDDEMIASPVVEYALTGNGSLPDYAVVIMPFLGSPADLNVRKFQSDEGYDTIVASVNVPMQEKNNEDVDAFYIIKDWVVYIYTKSFSGFYCTTCKHRPISLRCFLFGSYKRFTNPFRHEVRIMLYLTDSLMKFADYRERMLTIESAEGRVLKKEMALRLPQELCENDIIQASVTPTESHTGHWIHKLYPEETTPIFDPIQTLRLEDVAEKCKNCEFCHLPEHEIPQCIEWYLTNAEGVIPYYTFQCIIDINVMHEADNSKTSNRIVIDELQLRHEDRYPIGEDINSRRLKGIKEYLAGAMTAEKRDAVLGSLMSEYRCTGSSVEDVFFKLEEKLTPQYILEAVANVLKKKQMFNELDALHVYGFLPQNLISANMQEVCVEDNGQTCVANPLTRQQSDRNEDTVVEDESRDILQVVTDVSACNVLPSESHKPTKSKSTNNTEVLAEVRAELSHTQRVSNVTRSLGDLTLTAESSLSNLRQEISASVLETGSALPNVRGEISTPSLESKSTPEFETLHAQECASLDETKLKETLKKKNNEE